MGERGLGSTFQVNEGQRSFNAFRQRIYRDLDIDGVGFPKLSGGVKEDVVSDFARILIATSGSLGKPIPDIGLINDWNEMDVQDHEIREVSANALVENAHPNGIIRVAPSYLGSEFARRLRKLKGEDAGYGKTFPLEFLLAHEDYHIWQFLHQRERVEEDCKIFAGSGGLAAWNLTQTEVDAKDFANHWIIEHGLIV